MGRVANPKLASVWRDRVERQRRSGMSILEYCRRAGVSAGSFYAWKRRLQASPPTVERKSKEQGQKRASHRPTPRGGFVQFPLAVDAPIEVRFADGTKVNLPAENLAALAVTLKTLQASQREGVANA
jgi:hypothetical protein